MTQSDAFEGSKILILDFGSQYTQVIARRIRECQVYSQIVPFDTPARAIKETGALGLILSGGPASVYAKGAPIPILPSSNWASPSSAFATACN